MKDTVSHYVPPHSPLTSTEPQAFSNNLTMPFDSLFLRLRLRQQLLSELPLIQFQCHGIECF